MASLKSITNLPVVESAEGVNLIVEDNGVAKRIAADAAGLGGTSDAVQYIEQELTEEQQMQARKNLGLYNESIGEVDIVPAQQVTFVDGVAEFSNFFDPSSDLGLVADRETIPAVLEINGDVIEGEIYYYYVMQGTFSNYSIEYNRITLGEGASVQNGETVTVRMYAVAEIVATIDEKYLPKNAATAVSYNEHQSLENNHKYIARTNIDASKRWEQVDLLEVIEDIDFTKDEDVEYTINLQQELNYYNFDFLEIIGEVFITPFYRESVNTMIPISSCDCDTTLVKTIQYNEDTRIQVEYSNDGTQLKFIGHAFTDGNYQFRLHRVSGIRIDRMYVSE